MSTNSFENTKITELDRQRYLRQMRLTEIGELGQVKLKKSSILIIGAGGLGSPAALYLAAAGVGQIGIIDFDRVDISNLHRQILYSSNELGKKKVDVAVKRLQELNPSIVINGYAEQFNENNARELISNYDLIIDGTDNFTTRYLINDSCYFEKKPLISASVIGFEGQIGTFNHLGGPCYRCVFPEPPPTGVVPSCSEAGIIGAVPGLFGALQATEAIKLLVGIPVQSTIVLCDTLNLSFKKLKIINNAECPLCGLEPKIHDINSQNFICSTDLEITQISIADFLNLKDKKPFLILDVRDKNEIIESKLDYDYNIPADEIKKAYNILPIESPILVYCHSGNRSQKVCLFLKSKGYNVTNLSGGLISLNFLKTSF